MSEIKKMNIKDFRAEGYLQELNRRFLHPLGLAMEVIIEEDGTEKLGDVWDYREEDEGMCYHKTLLNNPVFKAKKEKLDKIIKERRSKREKILGFWIQSDEETV